MELTDIFPHIGSMADDLCVVRSLKTEQINHDTAHAFMNTGSIIKGRPSMGSWLTYGLGAETQDLPGFIVLTSAGKSGQQPISARQWSSGVLPSRFQGIQFQSRGDAVHYIGNPDGVCQSTQRQVVDEIARMNGFLGEQQHDPEIATRIAQYELAFKMQTSVPDLVNFKNEPKEMLDLYGVKEAGDGSYASNCLLARRLAERGVRMIQLYHRAWDHHGDLENGMKSGAQAVDQATAALIKDLKQRGLLDSTLVVWGGEFGRTVYCQGGLTRENYGRDHHPRCFPIWLAGGGIKGGITAGESDQWGYKPLDRANPTTCYNIHATMMHLLGIDHEKLTVRHNGIVVQDKTKLPHATTAAPLGEGATPGPLYLQDHGNPVVYRNVWISPK
jgi:hypothetical protein